jgi:type IV pilus assembly protein PilE
MPRKTLGFTLIEMMIVVAIIGILAAIAIPSYQEYVLKSRRTDATVTISKIQQAQEKWRANNPSYTTILGTNGLNLTSGGDTDTINSENSYYSIEITDIDGGTDATKLATGYIVTASAQGKQANDKVGSVSCSTLTMTVSSGNSTGKPTACWSK